MINYNFVENIILDDSEKDFDKKFITFMNAHNKLCSEYNRAYVNIRDEYLHIIINHWDRKINVSYYSPFSYTANTITINNLLHANSFCDDKLTGEGGICGQYYNTREYSHYQMRWYIIRNLIMSGLYYKYSLTIKSGYEHQDYLTNGTLTLGGREKIGLYTKNYSSFK